MYAITLRLNGIFYILDCSFITLDCAFLSSVLDITITVKRTIEDDSIHIAGMDIYLIKMLYNSEPDNPPTCSTSELTDSTDALTLFGISAFSITPSGTLAIPKNR